MLRTFGLGTVLVLLLCVSGGLFGQDAKPQAKAKGTLPANWGKLGLTDEQKQKIYSIQAKYQGEIAEMDAKLKQLRKTRDSEMAALLTDAQKARLKELAASKLPGTEEKKGETKAGGDKKEEKEKKGDKK